MGARTWQLQVAVALVLLVGVADAKPTIQVQTRIDPSDSMLRERLAAALRADSDTRSPEEFITDQFITAFKVVPLFEFVKTGAPEQTLELVVTSKGGSRARWPNANARIELVIGSQTERSLTLFDRDHCRPVSARKPCYPSPLTDAEWYADLFGGLIKQWPPGLFGGIVFSRQARYESGGVVWAREPMRYFGETREGRPTAVFQIVYGDIQRQFAFCKDTSFGAKGQDQGTSREALANPWCFNDPLPRSPPSGDNGRITLLKFLVQAE